MPVPRLTLAYHFSLQYVQGRKQRRGAVALVVMSVRAPAALLQRQPGLSAVQRLNPAFLVHTQDHCLLRRIQVQPHRIGQFLQKLGVPRELEGALQMRLQIVHLPEPVHSVLAHPLRLCHRSTAPAGLAFGLARFAVVRGASFNCRRRCCRPNPLTHKCHIPPNLERNELCPRTELDPTDPPLLD
jgi:hypothetical protein